MPSAGASRSRVRSVSAAAVTSAPNSRHDPGSHSASIRFARGLLAVGALPGHRARPCLVHGRGAPHLDLGQHLPHVGAVAGFWQGWLSAEGLVIALFSVVLSGAKDLTPAARPMSYGCGSFDRERVEGDWAIPPPHPEAGRRWRGGTPGTEVSRACECFDRMGREAFICRERGSPGALFLRIVASHERPWRAALPADRHERKIASSRGEVEVLQDHSFAHARFKHGHTRRA